MKGVATLAKFCPFLPTNCLLIRYLRTKLTCISNSPRSFFNAETYFTGLSDCHKLVLSVFKTTFSKTGPKEMMYRDYKNFDQDIFSQLCTSLSSETVLDYVILRRISYGY